MRFFGKTFTYLMLILCGLTMIIPFAWMITTALRTQLEVNRGRVGFDLSVEADYLLVGDSRYPIKIVKKDATHAWILFYSPEGTIDPLYHRQITRKTGIGNEDYPKVPLANIRHEKTYQLVWSNFSRAFNKVPFARYFMNTILVALVVTAGSLLTGALAAYAFARMRFRGRDTVFYLFISMMMVPQPIFLIPSYIILNHLGWIDTYMALIVPWLANIFTIFLLRQHFMTIPQDLFDAASIDGCNRFGMLWKIVLPLSKSVIATTSIFSVIGSWNSFMWPLIVTNSEEIRVLQVGLSYFSQEASTQTTLLMAASTFSIIPLVILFLLAQRQIIESFTSSGLKE